MSKTSLRLIPRYLHFGLDLESRQLFDELSDLIVP